MALHYCEVCNKPFAHKGNYLIHVKTHEKSNCTNNKNSLECEYCNKKFKYNGTLKHHITHVCKKTPNQQLKDKEQTMEIRLAKMEAIHMEKIKELEKRLNAHDEQLSEITETINEITETAVVNINIKKVIINYCEKSISNILTQEQLKYP